MKKLIVIMMMMGGLLVQLPLNAKGITVYDEYYSVHNGVVTETVVHNEQKTFKSPKEINCYPFLFANKLRELAVEESIDNNGQLTELTERKDSKTYIVHHYTYDNWGSIKEEKCETHTDDGVQTSVLTYEYFYLDKFTYAKKNGKKFISGQEPDYNSLWVRCTVKKEGEIIQSINRRIRNR